MLSTGTLEVGNALSPDHLLDLQRTVGNRAISQVIQRAPGPDDERPVATGATTAVGTLPPVDDRPERPTAKPADPNAVVPVGAPRGPISQGAPLPPGYGGAIDQVGNKSPPKNASEIPDHAVVAAYRKNPGEVFRSPSHDWHYQMWHFQKGPGWGDEPPVAFKAGNVIAVSPDYKGDATAIPANISGDDRTGLGTPGPATTGVKPPQAGTPTPPPAPLPERPFTRAIQPGFSPGPEPAGRQTAVPLTRAQVVAAIEANPKAVFQSPNVEWHGQGYQLDKGKGETPTAYRIGNQIFVAPNSSFVGVTPLPAYGAPAVTTRKVRGDVNVTPKSPGIASEVLVEDETTDGDTKRKRTRGGSATVGLGTAALGARSETTETKGDTATTAKTAGNLTLKSDGTLALGGERTREKVVTKPDGTQVKTGTGRSGTLELNEKGLAASGALSKTTASGAKHSATGGAKFDPSTGNASVNAGYAFQSKGGASFTPSVSGGIEVQASDPIPAEGGGFDVTYTVTSSTGASIGGGKQAGKGPTVGIQIGSTQGTLENGTRHFDDEKKAKAFRDKAARVIAGERFFTLPPTSVAGALMIPIGEERGSGETSGSSVGGSVSFEGASLGYGESKSTTHQFRVRRISDKVVQVTGSVTGTKGSDVTGSGGITLTKGSSETKGFAVTWEFDLGTKQGRDAFERYAKTSLPPLVGATLKSMTSSGSEEDHDNVTIPLLGTAKWTGTTWEIVKTDAKGGRNAQFGGQKAHNQDPSWFGKKVLGQDKLASSAQITSTLEGGAGGGEKEVYEAEIKVSGDSGEYNRQQLGELFSGIRSTGPVKRSGEWTLTAQVSGEVVRQLEQVNDEMRAARTKEDKMRVYSRLVKENGARMVRMQVGLAGDPTAWTLELKGDANFPGPAGRAELDTRRAALKDRLKNDPKNARSVARDAQVTLNVLAARRNAVKDKSKYTDLPDGLRDQQLKLIDRHITDFEFIRHMASKEAVKHNPGEKVESVKGRMADKDGYRNDQNSAEGADMARLRDRIAEKEGAIKALDPRILRAINAVQGARTHTVNAPRGYGDFVRAKRADYNLHWDIGIGLNDRQMAMAPAADALRMKLLEFISPAERKSTAEALLAQLTNRLALLESLHMNVMAAAAALKPITSPRGFAGYPKFWGSVNGDEPPWAGGWGSD